MSVHKTQLMKRRWRGLLDPFVSTSFQDPFGLLLRIISSGNPAALSAVKYALLGVLCLPLDAMLQAAERRQCRRSKRSELPIIIVCGPPRSGTTLLAQTLIRCLPVSYFNNLTSIFPRSPIISNRILQRFLQPRLDFKSYYGKSQYISGPNDALYLWDRWLGHDRNTVPVALSPQARREMQQFFRAYLDVFQMPLVCKNNSLNLSASLVADVLSNAHFLCVQRDPVYLAQSLLVARQDIHGDVRRVYGIGSPNDDGSSPVQSVCRQVLYHEQQMREQQSRIGEERFWIVQYEQFCRDPQQILNRVANTILKNSTGGKPLDLNVKPFEASRRMKIEKRVFDEIKESFAQRTPT